MLIFSTTTRLLEIEIFPLKNGIFRPFLGAKLFGPNTEPIT